MGKHYDLKSFRVQINTGDSVGYTDWTPDKETEILAIHVLPVNTIIGDKLTVNIIYSNNIIAQYAKDTNLSTEAVEIDLDRGTPLMIPLGITAQLQYDAVDTNGRDFILWVRYRQ